MEGAKGRGRGLFLSDYLSREEFQCVWATVFVADATREAYGGESLTGDETIGELLRHGIRELSGSGFRFQGLDVSGDGEVVVRRRAPLEIRNRLYIAKLQAGSMPSPTVAIGALIRAVKERRPDCTLDVSPALAVAHDVVRARDSVLAQIRDDKELTEAILRDREMDWEILRQSYEAALEIAPTRWDRLRGR